MDTQAQTNSEEICCCYGPVFSSTYPDEDWYQDMGFPAHGDAPEGEWICLTDLLLHGPFGKRPKLLPPSHLKAFLFVHKKTKETKDTTEESETEEEEPGNLELNENQGSDSETIPEPHPKKRFLQRFLQDQ